MRKHRRINYRFTEKEHSVRGVISLTIAILSIMIGTAMIAFSFQSKGNGGIYLGSGGMLSLFLAIAAFVLAIQSMREENRYKLFPVMATLISGLALLGGISLYMIGFLA